MTVNRPVLGFDISNEFNMAIDAAHRIIGGFQGTSLQLDFMIYDAPGTGTNQISFLASHRPVNITHLEYTQSQTLISYQAPAYTKHVDIYTRSSNSGYWHLLVRIPRSQFSYDYRGPAFSKGTQIVAIGESSLINGLSSFPGSAKHRHGISSVTVMTQIAAKFIKCDRAPPLAGLLTCNYCTVISSIQVGAGGVLSGV